MQNYQKTLESLILRNNEAGIKPSLLLHVCCAPCASTVLEILPSFFEITLFFYNPNIHPETEFIKRLEELKKLLAATRKNLRLSEGAYEKNAFQEAVKGSENTPEGGERCRNCIALRLKKCAAAAKEGGFDYFCTTLTTGPRKDAVFINAYGSTEGEKAGVPFLPSDFKKKDGYKRSVELCREYGIYRQNYCGCEYSINKGKTG